jgi:hypothetical protein
MRPRTVHVTLGVLWAGGLNSDEALHLHQCPDAGKTTRGFVPTSA